MQRQKSKPTKWTALLQRAMLDEQRLPQGEGWKTFDEIQTETGIGEKRLRRIIRASIKAGLVEMFRGSRRGAEGENHHCNWYREVVK